MALKRIKPVMVKSQPPLTPIRMDLEKVARGRQVARRIAKGK